MKKIAIPHFEGDEAQQQLFKFLKQNKSALINQKKYYGKDADAISYVVPLWDSKDKAFKADIPPADLLAKDEIMVKVVINTTKLLDSHADVHMDGIWKKSLKETGKMMLHLQEHKEGFAYIIADGMDGEVKAYTEQMSWKDLGFDYKGSTEALILESMVKKARNEFMFEQYAKKYVKNHSVGMQYVKLFMCINSEEKYYREEKEYWDQYYPEIVNKEAADDRGYFWAVTEAKAREGSAVVRGSNFVTPTLEMKHEPSIHSKEEPEKHSVIDYKFLTEQTKKLNSN